MKGFEKYPSYKDSGADWLGEIPTGWDVIRTKFLVQFQKGKMPKKIVSDGADNLPAYMSMDYLRGGELKEWVEDRNVKTIDQGEILLLWDGSNAGEFLISRKGVISSTVALARYSSAVNRGFAWYYSKRLETELRKKTIGMGIPHVNGDYLNNLSFCVPPLPEQIAIAKFLDEKTEKIDQAIGQKEELIKLLKERKQILIQQAVTKGLNPDVPMKDSGIDWIGEIPEHWGVKRLRFLGQTQNGISAGGDFFGSGFPFITYGDVYSNIELPQTASGLAKATEDDIVNYSVKEGDVFFTRTSETVEEIGYSSVCFEAIENATFAGFLIRFRPDSRKIFKGFSKYFFSSVIHRHYFVKEMNLVTRASLSQELLKDLLVISPPLEEQKEIFEYLETQSSKIDESISLQKRQIEQLKEYKSVLIDSAVTGKIKVSEQDF